LNFIYFFFLKNKKLIIKTKTKKYFKEAKNPLKLRDCGLEISTLIFLLVCFFGTMYSKSKFSGRDLEHEFLHLLIGGGFGVTFLVWIYFFEKSFVQGIKKLLQTRKESKSS